MTEHIESLKKVGIAKIEFHGKKMENQRQKALKDNLRIVDIEYKPKPKKFPSPRFEES